MLRGRYGIGWMIVAWLALVASIGIAIWAVLVVGGVSIPLLAQPSVPS